MQMRQNFIRASALRCPSRSSFVILSHVLRMYKNALNFCIRRRRPTSHGAGKSGRNKGNDYRLRRWPFLACRRSVSSFFDLTATRVTRATTCLSRRTVTEDGQPAGSPSQSHPRKAVWAQCELGQLQVSSVSEMMMTMPRKRPLRGVRPGFASRARPQIPRA